MVGIVASRVVERYGRPTFSSSHSTATSARGRAGASPVSSSHAALTECGDLLERFGGHHMAAGLTVRRDNLGAFRAPFAGSGRKPPGPADLGPKQRIDRRIALEKATADFERLARYLEPCGAGNPTPVLGVRSVRFSRPRDRGQRASQGRAGGRRRPLGRRSASSGADRAAGLGEGPVDAAFRLRLDQRRAGGSAHCRRASARLRRPRRLDRPCGSWPDGSAAGG